jgi:hypothetical protein
VGCIAEPTTGLDSRNQADVVAFLRELANDGCNVVTTIHSPSEAVFRQFDHVLLLVRHVGVGGGSLAFAGSGADCDAWFALLGSPRPPHANPAEHALSCLDAEYSSLSLPSLWGLRRMRKLYQALPPLVGADAAAVADSITTLCKNTAQLMPDGDGIERELADLGAFSTAVAQGGGTYLAFVNAMLAGLLAADAADASMTRSLSALGLSSAAAAPRTVGRLNAMALRMESSCLDSDVAQPALDAGSASRVKEARPYATSGWTQWRLLLRREFLMLRHDRQQLATVAAMSIIIPLFLGGMYWRIDQEQANFTNLVAALFLSCLFAGVLPLNTTMMTFPQEQVIGACPRYGCDQARPLTRALASETRVSERPLQQRSLLCGQGALPVAHTRRPERHRGDAHLLHGGDLPSPARVCQRRRLLHHSGHHRGLELHRWAGIRAHRARRGLGSGCIHAVRPCVPLKWISQLACALTQRSLYSLRCCSGTDLVFGFLRDPRRHPHAAHLGVLHQLLPLLAGHPRSQPLSRSAL